MATKWTIGWWIDTDLAQGAASSLGLSLCQQHGGIDIQLARSLRSSLECSTVIFSLPKCFFTMRQNLSWLTPNGSRPAVAQELWRSIIVRVRDAHRGVVGGQVGRPTLHPLFKQPSTNVWGRPTHQTQNATSSGQLPWSEVDTTSAISTRLGIHWT